MQLLINKQNLQQNMYLHPSKTYTQNLLGYWDLH